MLLDNRLIMTPHLLQALDLYAQNHFDAFDEDLQALDTLTVGHLQRAENDGW
jgi:hypothetical protein